MCYGCLLESNGSIGSGAYIANIRAYDARNARWTNAGSHDESVGGLFGAPVFGQLFEGRGVV